LTTIVEEVNVGSAMTGAATANSAAARPAATIGDLNFPTILLSITHLIAIADFLSPGCASVRALPTGAGLLMQNCAHLSDGSIPWCHETVTKRGYLRSASDSLRDLSCEFRGLLFCAWAEFILHAAW
jgi:hypothetical protein